MEQEEKNWISKNDIYVTRKKGNGPLCHWCLVVPKPTHNNNYNCNHKCDCFRIHFSSN